MTNRSFRIININNKNDNIVDYEKGVYHGRGPAQAALKAFNWYCRKANLQECNRKITIEEITKNSNNKQFTYTASRQKLDIPQELTRNGSVYTIKYKSFVKALK
jgi:hypothetical protein